MEEFIYLIDYKDDTNRMNIQQKKKKNYAETQRIMQQKELIMQHTIDMRQHITCIERERRERWETHLSSSNVGGQGSQDGRRRRWES